MIYKIKIGRRTQKSAADDPKILAGCFFNPQNVYFEVCMVRAKVVFFMNYATQQSTVLREAEHLLSSKNSIRVYPRLVYYPKYSLSSIPKRSSKKI